MEVSLQNNLIQVRISSHGAEMTSLVDLESGRQMLWNADPEYWKRHSPVLFPIVGSVWEGVYRECGKEFRLGQHGFARDMEFTLLSQDDSSVYFELASSEETHKLYPYDFRLVIGYELSGKTVKVVWKVINPSSGDIHFQIGAHPAFLLHNEDSTVGGAFRLKLDGKAVERIDRSVLGEKGCLTEGKNVMEISDGRIDIRPDTFNHDALVIENSQADEVELLDPEGNAYLSVRFAAPLFGLWAPRKDMLSPFVCIEPWYGRCDRVRYSGEYRDKDWMQHLPAGETFAVSYDIAIL